MAVIGLEDDIGFAALLFVLFIGLLWITTGRVGYLVLGLVLFGVGAYIAARYFGQVHIRVEGVAEPVADRDQLRIRGATSSARPGTASAPEGWAGPAWASTTTPDRSPS